jgi:hypothetical protein
MYIHPTPLVEKREIPEKLKIDKANHIDNIGFLKEKPFDNLRPILIKRREKSNIAAIVNNMQFDLKQNSTVHNRSQVIGESKEMRGGNKKLSVR